MAAIPMPFSMAEPARPPDNLDINEAATALGRRADEDVQNRAQTYLKINFWAVWDANFPNRSA
jgi:hypothetical protein